jgi:hypothetical protein
VNINGEIKSLGTIKYGQKKTFICDIEEFKHISTIQYDSMNNETINIPISFTLFTDNNAVKFEIVRMNMLKAMNDILKFSSVNLPKSQEILRTSVSTAYEMIDAHPIIDDMVGEISSGFETTANVNRWGGHYLRSLITAHTNRDCLNFKDPGMKIYESAEIKKTREVINDIANSIEVPQPSIQMYTTTTTAAQPISRDDFMSSYNNAYGGCFGGDGIVALQNGNSKMIKSLKKGDILHDGAVIQCVITFEECDTITIEDGNLEITPWHPIFLENKWVFPNTRKILDVNSKKTVYNFILDTVHIININGVNCCTLGHNFAGPVIEHEFYGTQKVINDLKKFDGYADGIVKIQKTNLVFNDSGTEIIGYKA